MSLFERDTGRHVGSPGDQTRDDSTSPGSSSEADDSAAHIAELVRRSAERDARPGPSSAGPPTMTMAQPQASVPPVARHTGQAAAHASALTTRRPPLWVLAAGAGVAAVLIATGFALAQKPDTRAATVATPSPRATAAPAFVVRASDVITDCAGHSYGKTKRSFERHNCEKAARSLLTGRVSGRPALFVVSRIEMASPDEAASIKQVLDANETGNLNDLLREGKTFPGAPARMPRSGYSSVQRGIVVVVAEVGFTDGGLSSNTNPTLRAEAAKMANRQN